VTIGGPERPRVRAIVGHLAASVLLANVIPAVLFYLCFRAGNVWLALVAALAWCYGAIAWRKATRRPSSGLMWLTVVALTAKSALAFATGSTFLYFLQPALTDCVIAVIFLVSLTTARPVVARLAADFYPMSRDVAERPRIQQLFWRLTFLWAVICLAKAVSTIWLLHELPVASFLTVKTVVGPSVAVGGAALTFWLALRVARREGLIRTERSG
jgi:uncharacterized membrane protein